MSRFGIRLMIAVIIAAATTTGVSALGPSTGPTGSSTPPSTECGDTAGCVGALPGTPDLDPGTGRFAIVVSRARVRVSFTMSTWVSVRGTCGDEVITPKSPSSTSNDYEASFDHHLPDPIVCVVQVAGETVRIRVDVDRDRLVDAAACDSGPSTISCPGDTPGIDYEPGDVFDELVAVTLITDGGDEPPDDTNAG